MNSASDDSARQAGQGEHPLPAAEQYPQAGAGEYGPGAQGSPPPQQAYPSYPGSQGRGQDWPNAYGQPAAGQSRAFALASLILGIISVIAFGIVAGPLAIIFGALRLKPGSAGRGLAIAGVVLGIIGTVLAVVLIVGSRWYD